MLQSNTWFTLAQGCTSQQLPLAIECSSLPKVDEKILIINHPNKHPKFIRARVTRIIRRRIIEVKLNDRYRQVHLLQIRQLKHNIGNMNHEYGHADY